MVYRHFPGISDREFSILSVSLADAGSVDAAFALAEAAAGAGINLACAGFTPGSVSIAVEALERSGLRERFSVIAAVQLNERSAVAAESVGAGKSPAGALDELVRLARLGPRDIVSIRLADGADGALPSTGEMALSKAGWVAAAERLKASGTIAACGMRVPADGATLVEAADAWPTADFIVADCNTILLGDEKRGLRGAIRYAAELGIGFVATDPLAGGALEKVSPAVHELYRNAPVPRAHDEWALRAIWDMQETVSVALAPRSAEALSRAAIFAEAGRPNSLRAAEREILAEAAKKLGQ
jgi:hypothetical protein